MDNLEEFVELINKAEARYRNSTREDRINMITCQMMLIEYLKSVGIDLSYNLDSNSYEVPK